MPHKARIVAIIHEYDRLTTPRLFGRPRTPYLLADIFAILKTRGYATGIIAGSSGPADADLAVLHVDATHTADDYLQLAARFPVCANARVADISKSAVSDALVTRDADWTGPVIVKTDLNTKGSPEAKKNARAARWLRPPPFPGAPPPRAYEIFPSLREVPAAVWDDPASVVERFLSERLPDGSGMCHYVFCGDYEFCARFVGTNELVKSQNIFRHERIAVPQSLRDRRKQLGFDYGKFDFVFDSGKACLVDANKTPGRIPSSGGASLEGLADGLLGLIKSRG